MALLSEYSLLVSFHSAVILCTTYVWWKYVLYKLVVIVTPIIFIVLFLGLLQFPNYSPTFDEPLFFIGNTISFFFFTVKIQIDPFNKGWSFHFNNPPINLVLSDRRGCSHDNWRNPSLKVVESTKLMSCFNSWKLTQVEYKQGGNS